MLTAFFSYVRHVLAILRTASLTPRIFAIAALRTGIARVAFLIFSELALVVAILHTLVLVRLIHIIWHKNKNLLEDLYLE